MAKWMDEIDGSIHGSKKAAEESEASHFIEKEMRHKKGRTREQAIAIGLSRARAAGVHVPRRKRRN